MASAVAAPAPRAPTAKPSPWGAPRPAAALSMAALQREEQSLADGRLAAKLQITEERAYLSGASSAALDSAPVSAPLEVVCDDDAALAARLQAEEDALASASAPAVPAAQGDDEALARVLQLEFDAENDREVTAAERRANMFTASKVSISMDRHRSHGGFDAFQDADADDADEYEDDGTAFEHGTGAMVTKHDAVVCVTGSGDMRKGHDAVGLSNRVFNHLKRFSQRTEKQRQRLHEKARSKI